MNAPDGRNLALWCVILHDGARTVVLDVPDCPSALIARSLAVLQAWQGADTGAPINVARSHVTSVERVDRPDQ